MVIAILTMLTVKAVVTTANPSSKSYQTEKLVTRAIFDYTSTEASALRFPPITLDGN